MISNTDKIKGHVEWKAVLISCQVKVLCRTSAEYLPMCLNTSLLYVPALAAFLLSGHPDN